MLSYFIFPSSSLCRAFIPPPPLLSAVAQPLNLNYLDCTWYIELILAPLLVIIHAFHTFNVLQTQHEVGLLIFCAEIATSYPPPHTHTDLCPACHPVHTPPSPTPYSHAAPPPSSPFSSPCVFFPSTLQVNLAKRTHTPTTFPAASGLFFQENAWLLLLQQLNLHTSIHYSHKVDSHLLAFSPTFWPHPPSPSSLRSPVQGADPPNLPADWNLVLL